MLQFYLGVYLEWIVLYTVGIQHEVEYRILGAYIPLRHMQHLSTLEKHSKQIHDISRAPWFLPQLKVCTQGVASDQYVTKVAL